MKLTPISKAFFGVPEDDQYFNLEAATEVFKWYMSDPEAEGVMMNVLAEEMPRLLEYHSAEISKHYDQVFQERKALITKAVVNGVISKSMSDDTINQLVETVELIEKARSDEYTIWERQENARRQWRDRSGRFRHMGSMIVPPSKGKKVDDSVLNSMTPENHTPASTENIREGDAAAYQQTFAQISGMLAEGAPRDMSAVLVWRARNGQEYTREVLGNTPQDIIQPIDFEGGARLQKIETYALGDSATSPNSSYDALRSFGASGRLADQMGYQIDSGSLKTDNVKGLVTGLEGANKYDPMESGSTRGMRRIKAGSDFAESVFGNVDDPRIKAAIKAGQWVGQYGPEAEKVVGPHARKSAYRYRGTERKPDPKLGNAYRSALTGVQTPTEARLRLIYGHTRKDVVGRGDRARTIETQVESPVINYFRHILPQEDLLRLHTDSGAIAPSQGVIISSKGELVTQAAGYGDDHYLPFNLKNLKGLKGGEYIRTRTLGGPTTEDVYTGLASGARAFTVVSHSGVYTVEFADDFRGGRRFNDKAGRMVKRYGKLLDSLQAEQTTLADVPVDRMKELQIKATSRYPGDSDSIRHQRAEYLKRLVNDERTEPTASKERQNEWAEEFLNAKASEFDDGSGRELAWADVRGAYVKQVAQETQDSPFDVARSFETPEGAITSAGWADEYKRFKETKERDYVTTLKPLRLNGEGYYKALQALQEQFPYYITKVEYRPWEKASNKKDIGYVKPNFNRSASIKEGYWDPSIEGYSSNQFERTNSQGEKKPSGKVSADRTNYQNYLRRMKTQGDEGGSGAEQKGTPAAPGGSGGAANAPANRALGIEEKAQRAVDLRTFIKSGQLMHRGADGLGTPSPLLPKDLEGMRTRDYTSLLSGTDEDFLYKYVSDETFRQMADDEIRRLRLDDKRFVIPADVWDRFDSTGKRPVKSFDVEASPYDNKSYFTFAEDNEYLGESADVTPTALDTFVFNNEQIGKALRNLEFNFGAISNLDDPQVEAKASKALQALVQQRTMVQRSAANGDYSSGPVDIAVGGEVVDSPEEAITRLNELITGTAKLRQAKRRYDEKMRKASTPSVEVRRIGFEGREMGGGDGAGGAAKTLVDPDQRGPNGTKVDPNGGALPNNLTYTTADDDFMRRNAGNTGTVLKGLTPIQKMLVKRDRSA